MFVRNHRPHGPAWLESPLAFDEVAQHRNMACGLYGICLEVVVRRKWPSFTCRPCSLYHRSVSDSNQVGPAEVLPMPLAGQRQAI